MKHIMIIAGTLLAAVFSSSANAGFEKVFITGLGYDSNQNLQLLTERTVEEPGCSSRYITVPFSHPAFEGLKDTSVWAMQNKNWVTAVTGGCLGGTPQVAGFIVRDFSPQPESLAPPSVDNRIVNIGATQSSTGVTVHFVQWEKPIDSACLTADQRYVTQVHSTDDALFSLLLVAKTTQQTMAFTYWPVTQHLEFPGLETKCRLISAWTE